MPPATNIPVRVVVKAIFDIVFIKTIFRHQCFALLLNYTTAEEIST
jgi:hypothetical protein